MWLKINILAPKFKFDFGGKIQKCLEFDAKIEIISNYFGAKIQIVLRFFLAAIFDFWHKNPKFIFFFSNFHFRIQWCIWRYYQKEYNFIKFQIQAQQRDFPAKKVLLQRKQFYHGFLATFTRTCTSLQKEQIDFTQQRSIHCTCTGLRRCKRWKSDL